MTEYDYSIDPAYLYYKRFVKYVLTNSKIYDLIVCSEIDRLEYHELEEVYLRIRNIARNFHSAFFKYLRHDDFQVTCMTRGSIADYRLDNTLKDMENMNLRAIRKEAIPVDEIYDVASDLIVRSKRIIVAIYKYNKQHHIESYESQVPELASTEYTGDVDDAIDALYNPDYMRWMIYKHE